MLDLLAKCYGGGGHYNDGQKLRQEVHGLLPNVSLLAVVLRCGDASSLGYRIDTGGKVMQQIELIEAKQQLSELLDEAIRGAEIVITENGQPLVRLSHAATPKPRPQFGSARGLITIPDDFDEPLEDFKEYLQ